MSFFSKLYRDAGGDQPLNLPSEDDSGSLQDTQFRLQVEAVLNDVRPMLHADGGDIELVDVVGKSIKVRMVGACDGCTSAVFTLKLGIEKRLREEIPDFGDIISL